MSVLVEECRELLPNGSVTISGVDDGKEATGDDGTGDNGCSEGIDVDVDEVVDNPEYEHRIVHSRLVLL